MSGFDPFCASDSMDFALFCAVQTTIWAPKMLISPLKVMATQVFSDYVGPVSTHFAPLIFQDFGLFRAVWALMGPGTGPKQVQNEWKIDFPKN